MKYLKKIHKYNPRTITETSLTWWQKFLGGKASIREVVKIEIEWIVFPSLVSYLEDVVRLGSKGNSHDCFTHTDSKFPSFTVDRGRKKLVIQTSAPTEKMRHNQNEIFDAELPESKRICVDGKWWEIKIYVRGQE